MNELDFNLIIKVYNFNDRFRNEEQINCEKKIKKLFK